MKKYVDWKTIKIKVTDEKGNSQEFIGLVNAIKALGLSIGNRSNICNNLNKPRKYKGYYWSTGERVEKEVKIKLETVYPRFEEARKCLHNLFMSISPGKQNKKPELVWKRSRHPEKEEITPRDLLQDLYISWLEDKGIGTTYQEQKEMFNKWCNQYSRKGVIRLLKEFIFYSEGNSATKKRKSAEIVNKEFRVE